MKSKKAAQKPSPVDVIIKATAERHANEARQRKFTSELSRLGQRGEVGNAFYQVLMAQVRTHKGQRVKLTPERVAAVAEEAAKQALKTLGLDPPKDKD